MKVNANDAWSLYIGDSRQIADVVPEKSVHTCVTSPPYWNLRDYGVEGQIGQEPTVSRYVEALVEIFHGVRQVLRDDGTLWLNLGDTYCDGNLMGVPWRVALALQDDGWVLRSEIIWSKKSPMPESVTNRPTKSHETIFLFSKSNCGYYYDATAVREPGTGRKAGNKRNKYHDAYNSGDDRHRTKAGLLSIDAAESRNQWTVWHLGNEPYKEAHFATFPSEIPRRAIKAGTSERGCCSACGAPWKRVTERTKLKRERPRDYKKRQGDAGTGNSCANSVAGVSVRTVGWEPTCHCVGASIVPCAVLDPFAGSGTTIRAAVDLGRYGIGFELNEEYAALAERRITERKSEGKAFVPAEGQMELFAESKGGE